MTITPDDKSLSARDVARLLSDRICARNAGRVRRVDSAVDLICAVLLGIVGALVLAHWLAGA